MMNNKILTINSRAEFRIWLEENHAEEKECYIICKRGKPVSEKIFYYIDAVEEALCYGWIDSTIRKIDGVSYQRFSPRGKKSNWTELNKERIRRLEKLGLIKNSGRAVLPPMDVKSFQADVEVVNALKNARIWSKFKKFHPLYQRVRLNNLAFYRARYPEAYLRMLNHVIEETKKGKTVGEWNDYGRLLDY